ncbi:haloacid dehalogenase [Clostridium zeae]|uniref:Haloacid dehalogenase n=1 Tax=Clostridium zeae TaxID=2759022 RepID=A0ABQ1E5F8_9CLOT|nr:HAD family hydrolase [Clostridium zeae]GFZ29965.1 haloacid dehalogenase [Clostridium zeae]
MGNKITFLDIDGTLVDVPSGMIEPAQSTIEALKKFRENGNYTVVATARSAVPNTISKLDFDGYIFCNGNYIVFKDEVLHDNYFSIEDIQYIMDLSDKCDAQYLLSGHHGVWCSDLDHPLCVKQRELFLGGPDKPKDSIEIWKIEDVHANMGTILFKSEKDMTEFKEKLPTNWVVHAYVEANIRLDIHLPGFSKGSAVEFLFKRLGIDKEDTFAFGDAQNDIEMLKLVKHGIAMGNGTDEIKSIAYYVTDKVDKDGIANALKKFRAI